MIPSAFDYTRPRDLAEALRILKDREGEAKVLSGGYSLLPLVKLRLAQPALLVDLRDVGGLDAITLSGGEFRIGGRATHRAIQTDAALTSALPIMLDAAAGIGDPQIRNWGTIGGSVAHADPAADWPAVLQALHASIVLQRTDGERVVPARGFFVDTFQTGIEATEILTQVRIPVPPAKSGGSYQKLERRAGDFSTVGVAAQLTLDADGMISAIGLGLTAVAEAPFAATDAEAVLQGARPDAALFRKAAEATSRQSRPVTDSHGPAEYKRAMVTEMTIRALNASLARAQA